MSVVKCSLKTESVMIVVLCANSVAAESGFVPLSKSGAELLFEMLSQRYERGSTLVTGMSSLL